MLLNPHILVVDDDRRLRDLTAQFLTEHQFQVSTASNAAEARSQCAIQEFDAMVVDVMMPGETGIEFTKNIRQSTPTPILMLTARDQLSDKVHAFEIGVDDYLTKPFEPLELVARIKALLRRSKASIKNHLLLILGSNTFNTKTNTLTTNNNQNIPLTSTELSLLKILAQKPNHPFSRDDLAQRIGHRISERAVDVQITRLRKRIGDDPKQPILIQTIRHIGYALHPSQIIDQTEGITN